MGRAGCDERPVIGNCTFPCGTKWRWKTFFASICLVPFLPKGLFYYKISFKVLTYYNVRLCTFIIFFFILVLYCTDIGSVHKYRASQFKNYFWNYFFDQTLTDFVHKQMVWTRNPKRAFPGTSSCGRLGIRMWANRCIKFFVETDRVCKCLF